MNSLLRTVRRPAAARAVRPGRRSIPDAAHGAPRRSAGGRCRRTPSSTRATAAPAVRTLQCAINDLGLGPVVVDGYYGPQTKAALRPVVEARRRAAAAPLPDHQRLLDQLYGAQLPDQRAAASATRGPAVQHAAAGAAGMRALDIVVDGNFGSQTEMRWRRYQTANGVDGRPVGSTTPPATCSAVASTGGVIRPAWAMDNTAAAVRWSQGMNTSDTSTRCCWSSRWPCCAGLLRRRRPRPSPVDTAGAKAKCRRTLRVVPGAATRATAGPAVRTLQCALNDVGSGAGRRRRVLRCRRPRPRSRRSARDLRGAARRTPTGSTTAFWVLALRPAAAGQQPGDGRPRSGPSAILQRALRAGGSSSWWTATSAPRPGALSRPTRRGSTTVRETGRTDRSTRFYLDGWGPRRLTS